MSEPLYESLKPYLEANDTASNDRSQLTTNYLNRLATLSLSSLTSTESDALSYDSQSLHRSLQALSKRSYKSIDTSVGALASLHDSLPNVVQDTNKLRGALPTLETQASAFAEKYNRLTENELLDRRKRIMRLGDNVDRLAEILELPALLSSTIAASGVGAGTVSTPGAMSSANANYTSALDLYAHIRRLQRLYPDSTLVNSIVVQSEDAMRTMTSNLISSLRSQSLKLAGGMRLIGLLRRVAPDLDDLSASSKAWTTNAGEGSLGAMFLVCRLSALTSTLEALEPLRELADQESKHDAAAAEKNAWAAGQQTERYLKRYVEVFREQCFSIISMYKSIFPSSLPGPGAATTAPTATQDDLAARVKSSTVRAPNGHASDDASELPDDNMQKLPAAVATFALHIVDLLTDTLKKYMPNIKDQGSRDSLLTQVLYCAASLGRLGADFGMVLSMMEDDLLEADGQDKSAAAARTNLNSREPEWVQIMKKHRIQAGRLEVLASSANKSANRSGMASPG